MALQSLVVWINGSRVGEWRIPVRGSMEFAYDADWLNSPHARPLSLSLPLTFDVASIRGHAVESYFENLLPDSEVIRKRLQQKFKTTSSSAFDLLAAIGRDCIGAIQLLPADETPKKLKTIDAEPLTKLQVAREIAKALSPVSIDVDDGDFRISLAGAQEKTAFLRHDGKWCRPLGSTPTTHIFKLPLGLVGNMRADMSTSVENEWLCSRIFSAFGVPIAHTSIDTFGEFKVLIVERFDRVLHSSGKYWLRLVQEDMCQATATPSHMKYEAEGGPGLLDIARVLNVSANREADLVTLFKAQLLFWLLAATDGHAKNFSLRILEGGRYQLTPLYDVLSAWPVIGKKANQIPLQKARLAMAMHSKSAHYKICEIHRRHFDQLAVQMGIASTAQSIIDEIVANKSRVIDEVSSELPKDFPSVVSEAVFKGLENSTKQLVAMIAI